MPEYLAYLYSGLSSVQQGVGAQRVLPSPSASAKPELMKIMGMPISPSK